MKYLKYISYLVRHKWFVMLACFRRGLIWRGLVHDLSKFRPSEFFPYMEHFYGKGKRGINEGRDKTGYYKPTDTGDAAFDFAWLLHQKRNPHHWQWWILPEDEGGVKVLVMREKYLLEMLCDWEGAARAQGVGNIDNGWLVQEWYLKNRSKMQLNPGTSLNINIELGIVGGLKFTDGGAR